MIIRKYVPVMPWIQTKLLICKSKGHENFGVMRFVLITWPWRLPEEWPEAVVWPRLVLELCAVLALTQLGIRQFDWWGAGIRSIDLQVVVESVFNSGFWNRKCGMAIYYMSFVCMTNWSDELLVRPRGYQFGVQFHFGCLHTKTIITLFDLFKFNWSSGYISHLSYQPHYIGSLNLSHCCHIF